MMPECEKPSGGYDDTWPPVRGDYIVGNPHARVAVVTLASQLRIIGSAISGPCKTENLGVEKIIANVISNCNIRFLLICGMESKGHLPGNTILALHKNGIDDKGRIVGSKGAIPFIQNLPLKAVERFQKQIELIDRIGLEDIGEIENLIEKHNGLLEPYPEEPFPIAKRRTRSYSVPVGNGDVLLGSGVVMDAIAWLVMEQEIAAEG
jgi:tetrahydromethanopterin S-methyltransferase subunit A